MSQIRIGWASRSISTEKPVNITGQFYMRISQGVMDPVTATALVLDSGDEQVIFVSCDLVTIYDRLLNGIREKVQAERPDIPVMKIILNATHTHCGPSCEDDIKPFRFAMEVASSLEHSEFVIAQCSDAIKEAWDGRAAGSYAYGYGYAVVAHSRRVCYFDDVSKRPGAVINSTHGVNGTSVMYGKTNDDNFSHYEAGADHFVNLLYTFDEQDRLTGAIVNIPCPSQISMHEWKQTADYWHEVREEIRARHGNIFILPQCAAAGDLSPVILHYKDAQERRFRLKYGLEPHGDRPLDANRAAMRRDIGQRVAAAFDEVLSWAVKDKKTEAKLKHDVRTVQLSKRLITEEQYEYAKAGYAEEMAKDFTYEGTPEEQMRANSMLVSLRNRYKAIIDRYEEQKEQPKHPMEMHVIGLGDIAFATNQFELYMDYQHRIQARSPFEQTFIVQLAGQPGRRSGTYLATERGAQGRGYSASMFCNRVSPEGGQELVEETVKILKEIHE